MKVKHLFILSILLLQSCTVLENKSYELDNSYLEGIAPEPKVSDSDSLNIVYYDENGKLKEQVPDKDFDFDKFNAECEEERVKLYNSLHKNVLEGQYIGATIGMYVYVNLKKNGKAEIVTTYFGSTSDPTKMTCKWSLTSSGVEISDLPSQYSIFKRFIGHFNEDNLIDNKCMFISFSYPDYDGSPVEYVDVMRKELLESLPKMNEQK